MLPNNPLERAAGSHSLAAAAQRQRYMSSPVLWAGEPRRNLQY